MCCSGNTAVHAAADANPSTDTHTRACEWCKGVLPVPATAQLMQGLHQRQQPRKHARLGIRGGDCLEMHWEKQRTSKQSCSQEARQREVQRKKKAGRVSDVDARSAVATDNSLSLSPSLSLSRSTDRAVRSLSRADLSQHPPDHEHSPSSSYHLSCVSLSLAED